MITAEEQIDLFYNKYSYELIKLFEQIKERSDTVVLSQCDNNTISDFIDLILNNVDLKRMWLKHHNH